MALPLAGVKVVELATLVAGPAGGSVLASLGADVIKVEPITGDPSRTFISARDSANIAPTFVANNIGKRSIAVDLRGAQAPMLLERLISHADVVIENFPTEVARRFGLDPDDWLDGRPSLIWVSVRGYGPAGGWADRRAVDGIIQADSGMMSVNGEAEREALRVGFPVVDQAMGYVVSTAVLTALIERTQRDGSTGRGIHRMLSMFDVALNLQSLNYSTFLATGYAPARIGNASMVGAPSESFRTKDGSVMVAAYMPDRWRTFCELLACDVLLTDSRFVDGIARLAHRNELVIELERYTIGFTSEELFKRLHAGGIMASVIRSYDEVLSCEQVVANDLVMEVGSCNGAIYRAIRSPVDLHGSMPRVVPHTGEHTTHVLRELGFDDAQIEDLVVRRAVGIMAQDAANF